MKVFIGWSHEVSHKMALAIHEWFPNVIQSIEPYVSSEDISKGSHWFSDVCDNLDQADFGIICLTPDNVNEPWILFEAGALGTKFGRSKVCPLLWRISATDLKGPLSHFQSCALNADDMLRLVGDINKQLNSSISDERLVSTFELWWPKLEEKLSSIHETAPLDSSSGKSRGDRDLLEEVLQRVRALKNSMDRRFNAASNVNVYECHQDNAKPREGSEGIELLQGQLDNFERNFIGRILKSNKFNLDLAARTLGIHRKTLEYKMKRLDIDMPN